MRNEYVLPAWEKKLKVPVFTQPVCLGREIAIHNIAFVILETPGGDNQDVSLPDPDPFFYLSLDPPHTGNTVVTSHPYMVGTHHEIGKSELFIGPFFGEPDPHNGRSIFIYCVWIKIIIITVIPNSCNSVGVYEWRAIQ